MTIEECFPVLKDALVPFIEVSHKLYEMGFVCAYDGNISMRFKEGILITPTHVCKGMLKACDLIVVDDDGKKLFGTRNASSELALHLALYATRPDIGAIVHAHPTYATAIYRGGRSVRTDLLMEAQRVLGEVPVLPYREAGTQALAKEVQNAMSPGINACIMERHGSVTSAKTLEEAYFLTESLERLAKTETIVTSMNF